ncbi:MAG: sulfotransferase [bacterium]
MSKKIFIIGRNRSGTKWLSNILANHDEISAVQREGAGGILEANLLRNYPKYFNLNNLEEKTAFEILFKESNFHRCSNIEGQVLKTGNYKSFNDFFESYMDELASTRKTSFWLQKAGSLELPALLNYFPDAKFIIIQRKNVFDNVLSSLFINNKKEHISTLSILKNVWGYWQHSKTEKKYKCWSNVKTISYENLKNNTNELTKQICDYIGIGFNEDITKLSYKPNTSFKHSKKEQYYTFYNIYRTRCLSFLISLIPLSILNFRKKKYRKGSLFQPLTFELYRNNKTKN